MIVSCESCLKGKQLTLNPRQEHMKITYHIYCGCFFSSDKKGKTVDTESQTRSHENNIPYLL